MYKLSKRTTDHHNRLAELKMQCVLFIFAVVVLQIAVTGPVPHYKPLTEEEAARLAAWTPGDQNVWELSGQFEGDMILAPNQRNGVTDPRLRWPNRVIPYVISNRFTASDQQIISQTLTQAFAQTCVRVQQRTTETDYVEVIPDNPGCFAYVGRKGGSQNLNLGRGCVTSPTIVHEFLHAAGFQHQQSASERDSYVTIMRQNIEKGMEHNFDKYQTNNFGERYDYGSLMHYGRYAFSANQQPTIVPKDPNAVIGEAMAMSATDIRKLNKMYGCA